MRAVAPGSAGGATTPANGHDWPLDRMNGAVRSGDLGCSSYQHRTVRTQLDLRLASRRRLRLERGAEQHVSRLISSA